MIGQLIVITGPSGVGKTTICSLLMSRFKRFEVAKTISSTTRAPRVGEVDGVDYRFLSRAAFERQIEEGAFLEHAIFAGNLYGTSQNSLKEMLTHKQLVFAVLELEGCRQLKGEKLPMLIFPIIPDDPRILEERIRLRTETNEKDIAKRLAQSKIELSAIHQEEFGTPIVNRTGQIEKTISEIQQKIEECLRKRART